MTRKLTNVEFIKKAQNKHIDKYDYSKVIYETSHTKVSIICKKHGEFLQVPSSHLSGKGCPECKREISGKSQRFTLEMYIEKAKLKHGNKYDYSKVVYVNSQTKIIIVCPIHGEFTQIPNSHLLGMGCQLCANQEINKKHRMSTEEFIRRSKEINGDYFDYSKTVYGTSQNDKITIICPIHGEFNQQPTSHLAGRGCNKCKSSRGERIVRKYLVEMGIEFEQEKWFPTCRYIKHLYFDFWIPAKNLLIEYDGIQHFEEVKNYKTKLQFHTLNFETVKIRDSIKTKWCLENNIRLERIKYNEDIKARLLEILTI